MKDDFWERMRRLEVRIEDARKRIEELEKNVG